MLEKSFTEAIGKLTETSSSVFKRADDELHETFENIATGIDLINKALRERLDDVADAGQPTDVESQKLVELLRQESLAVQTEQPLLTRRIEELERQLRERKEAPEPPKSVQVRPGGTGSYRAGSVFFIECHSTGITLLVQGGGAMRVANAAIPNSAPCRDFLTSAKETRDSLVLFLVRRCGRESYEWAVHHAEDKFGLKTGKISLPNDGPIDLSHFP